MPNHPREATIKMQLFLPYSNKTFAIELPCDLEEVTRPHEPLSAFDANINPAPFEHAVTRLKGVAERKKILADAGRTLGILLAERLEDTEGWHGEDRQERTLKCL